MKKLLLAASLLITSMTASFAQMPDASQWTKGQEITDQVGWGNLSFENPEFDFWRLESSKGSFTKTGSNLFEVYDGADVDLYQYIQLPAGMYRLECQGYYRCGTSWDDDPNSFGNPERWEDNALLYASNGTYDIDSDVFTKGRTFKCPLMPRLFENQPTQLYEDQVKEGWDMSDGNYGEGKGWGPCSVPGSQVWFEQGHYQPYSDDDVQYNTVTFFLTQDGWARVGVTKIDPRSADSFMATNFKLFYEGEAGEAAELMALQDEAADYYRSLEDLMYKTQGLLYTLISDALMTVDDEIGDLESLSTKEECNNAINVLKGLYEQAVAANAAYGQLEGIIEVMEILYNTTDYAGKDAFGAALQAAQNCLDPNYEVTADDNFDNFQAAYENLCAARITYLMTQEPVNGAYNFSSAINTAFFCDNQYTPMWNEDAQAYQFPTIEGVDEGLQPENTWATIQEQGYSDAKADAAKAEWIPICETVKIYEKATENQWVIKSTTWHGGALGVTMQHSYPAIGGWTAEPTGNPEILSQTITGLPNGYYSMSALMCNAGAEISALQYVYIEAGDFKETAPLTQKGNPWWGGNKEAWRSGVWEKLNTNMVYVADGKVTIGSSSDAFYAVTGFQLYYYGETPDFTSLVAPSLEAAKANAESLLWPGDKAAALAILANVPETIDGQEAYQAALATIAESNQYVATANNVINNWKGLENFTTLQDQFEEGTVEKDIATIAFMEVLNLGEGEDDTYLDAIAADEDYAAYVEYFAFRAGMGDLINNEGVAPVVADQNAYLTENYANAAKLNEFKQALAIPYNRAILSTIDLSQASEDNPVDVTALIVNPDFSELSRGWNGEMTVDSLGTVERWNCNLDINQTIYALPAGFYQVQVQALYRDAADAAAAYNNFQYTAGGLMEFWDNANAFLYANDAQTPIVSIGSEFFEDQSYTAYVDRWQVAEEGDEQGNDVWEPVWVYQADAEESAQNNYPWDTKVDDLGDIHYYPASLRGVSRRFEKSPEAYINKVNVGVTEDGVLTIGVKKDILISSDWVAFDNFKLFYLGTTIPTGIEAATAAEAAPAGIYNAAGVPQSKLQKGLNIVVKANGETQKVYVK